MTTIYKAMATYSASGLYSGAASAVPHLLESYKNKKASIAVTILNEQIRLFVVRIKIFKTEPLIQDPSDLAKLIRTNEQLHISCAAELRRAGSDFLGAAATKTKVPGVGCFFENPDCLEGYLFFTNPQEIPEGITDGRAESLLRRILSGDAPVVWSQIYNEQSFREEYARIRPAANRTDKFLVSIPKKLRGSAEFKIAVVEHSKRARETDLKIKLFMTKNDPNIVRLRATTWSDNDGCLRLSHPELIKDLLANASGRVFSKFGLVLETPEASWKDNCLEINFRNIFARKDLIWQPFSSSWSDLLGKKGIYVIFDSSGKIIDIGSSANQERGAFSRRKDNDHPEADGHYFWELPHGAIESSDEAVFVRRVEHDLMNMAIESQGELPKYNKIMAPTSARNESESLQKAHQKFREQFALCLPQYLNKLKKAV